MSYRDRGRQPAGGRIPRDHMDLRANPPRRPAMRSNLLWNWITAVAVAFILVVVFYGINAQRTQEGGSPAVTASPAPSNDAPSAPAATAGQAPNAGNAETTGQGGTPDQGTPQAPAANAPAQAAPTDADAR